MNGGAEGLGLFLSGDSIITRPWSHVQNPSFLELVAEIRAADVSITNLETVIHEFKGYAQANSGGAYLASPPEVARELRWAGFDVVAHANNHAFDYGSTGVLETLEHVERAGLLLAGSGKDLQEARAPRYCHTSNGTLGLVAMASDFVPYGKASYSRHDMPGRPGINPLTVTGGKRAILVPEPMRERLRFLTKFGLSVRRGDHYGLILGFQVDPRDLKANLAAIAEAASKSDIVVASIHAHRQGAWLTKFAHQAIEHGANIVFMHGPHKVGPIELYRGCPIFYSMGDFVFEIRYVTRFPAEAYEAVGLPHDAPTHDYAKARAYKLERPQSYKGIAASVAFATNRKRVACVRVLPIDLQFTAENENRGRPQLASPQLGREIITKLAIISRPLGTRIIYDEMRNCGELILE